MALSLEQLRRAADRVAASLGLDIVEIEYLGGKNRVLRVFIEKTAEERAKRAERARVARGSGVAAEPAFEPPAGMDDAAWDRLAWVTHEDCEVFSRDFGTVMDVEESAPDGEYTLEVSSPGLDRKLTTRADYERFLASRVKVQTFAPIAGNRYWQGRLMEVRDEGIVLDLEVRRQRTKQKGTPAAQTIQIDFAGIERANLVPDLRGE